MTADQNTCSSCGTAPAGDGGILCVPCRDRIAATGPADWYGERS